jgi:hypothetical protein
MRVLNRMLRLERSHLRTFAFELKEQLAQTLTTFVISILAEPRRHPDTEIAAEPPLRQIIDVLQLAVAVLEIYEDSYRRKRSSR